MLISVLAGPVLGLTLLDVADTEYFPNKVSNLVTSPKSPDDIGTRLGRLGDRCHEKSGV